MSNALDHWFVLAAGTALDLLERPEVAKRWDDPSALAQMTVGMLACHLGRQVVRTRQLLPQPTDVAPIPEAADHYRRAAWVLADDLDDPANDRSTDEQEAAEGVEALLSRCREALGGVEQMLSSGHAQEIVLIPWQGWSLCRADFLHTRMVEIVTHVDDLARSVDLPTPTFPDEAYRPVVNLLARLATERHGQAAMTSALTRRERMPDTISAF